MRPPIEIKKVREKLHVKSARRTFFELCWPIS